MITKIDDVFLNDPVTKISKDMRRVCTTHITNIISTSNAWYVEVPIDLFRTESITNHIFGQNIQSLVRKRMIRLLDECRYGIHTLNQK